MKTSKNNDDIREIIKDEIKHIPSKDEFFTKMDQVMGELQAIREELILISGRQSENNDQLEDHEERITKIEKRVTRQTPPSI